MRVAVFTSNQPRHCALVEALASVAELVYVVQEVTTVFPGEVEDFYRRSEVMQQYFAKVAASERKIFGGPRFLPAKTRVMPIKLGDLNRLPVSALSDALSCDHIIVFGASYIKAPLIDLLIERRAINIHMGVSPYYRGSGCNFWAAYDGNYDLIGATLHRLSAGLDSGDILLHALPEPVSADPFDLGMLAVKAAQTTLIRTLASGELASATPERQDKSAEIRYSRYSDFTDEVARAYLASPPNPQAVQTQLAAPPRPLVRMPSQGRA